ncbi:glycerol-3-phosphate responsive antiterminator [Paenibacillus validus]|uniref:Glycerol uptake operon antiterminator regulatory protein n=1 Tax=Paenibacillus validus TaxID=44253 RepID=A0A7X2Z6Z4_9BACL|nr:MULTISPECIES: glycerol-3-phosphate responsive antiterminator [Paenibacillus]MED4601797.1 glycerol-3-phosphate responsive antiterminator [Paenibacillus validus]MED4609090.1 glycerol-3-phosphate responsive antiterminator [Paenibacillus validus]MUG69438.1 glycerol-3-phosphate responsive antiterminator [Paenibacillus validus]
MIKNMVIPAVRNFKELEMALAAPQDVIFLLEGELIQLQGIVESVKRAKKKIYLHLDMVKGIKEDEASIHFLSKVIKIDGVISTRTSSLIHAKKYGLSAIQRGFLIDSHSIRTIIHAAAQVKPDYIEILPSFSYPKLETVKKETGVDIILGGFVEKKEDVATLFQAGAIAVSTSRAELW